MDIPVGHDFHGHHGPRCRKNMPQEKHIHEYKSRWWFQICFIFIPSWGRFHILTSIFQVGWNQQPVNDVNSTVHWCWVARSCSFQTFCSVPVGTQQNQQVKISIAQVLTQTVVNLSTFWNQVFYLFNGETALKTLHQDKFFRIITAGNVWKIKTSTFSSMSFGCTGLNLEDFDFWEVDETNCALWTPFSRVDPQLCVIYTYHYPFLSTVGD